MHMAQWPFVCNRYKELNRPLQKHCIVLLFTNSGQYHIVSLLLYSVRSRDKMGILPNSADVSEVFVLFNYEQRGHQMICGCVKYQSHPDVDPPPSL